MSVFRDTHSFRVNQAYKGQINQGKRKTRGCKAVPVHSKRPDRKHREEDRLAPPKIQADTARRTSSKREDYLTWDEYFMSVAHLSAMRSKDPATQVGCCIVDDNNRIMSVGYNGFPRGCSDDEFPWDKGQEDPLDEKYMYVVHSEMNAILNFRGESLAGCKLYVTMFPCNECAKAIIQSGISEVIYDSDAYLNKPSGRAAMRMFEAAGVKCTKYRSDEHIVSIRMFKIEKVM